MTALSSEAIGSRELLHIRRSTLSCDHLLQFDPSCRDRFQRAGEGGVVEAVGSWSEGAAPDDAEESVSA